MSLALEVTNVPSPAVAVMTNAQAAQARGVCGPISEASGLVSYLLHLLSVTVTVLGCDRLSRFLSCHHHLQEARPLSLKAHKEPPSTAPGERDLGGF